MIHRLRRAMQNQIPVDIYFNIATPGKLVQCIKYYPLFMVKEIDEENMTFSGFTLEQRNGEDDKSIFTTDSILPICEVDHMLL